MMSQIETVNNKENKNLKRGGFAIYRFLDGSDQDQVRKAIYTGNFKLEGHCLDYSTDEFIESVLCITKKYTPIERIKKKVNLWTLIQNIQRAEGEQVFSFAARCNIMVAQYANESSALSDMSRRQFALLMLRNVILIPNTLNSLLFRLNSSTKEIAQDYIGELLESSAKAVAIIELLAKENDETKHIRERQLAKLENLNISIVLRKRCDGRMFTVGDANQLLSQVLDAQ